MIIHRFMSQAEYEKYKAGEDLRNDTNHNVLRGEASTAIGFCWFDDDPEDAKHRLSGIVDFDICLTVEAPAYALHRCSGRYPTYSAPGVKSGIKYYREYCCRSYNRDNFKEIEASDKFRNYAPGASQLKELFPFIFV